MCKSQTLLARGFFVVMSLSTAAREVAGQIAFQTIALSGQAAPGLPAGVNYSSFAIAPAINDAGGVAYRAALTGTGVTGLNDFALYAGTYASPQLIAREGNAAPGTPAGVNYSVLSNQVDINDAGAVVYTSNLIGSGVSGANDSAIFAGSIASPQLVARTGGAAPGTPAGVSYTNFFASQFIPALSDAGHIIYAADLSVSGNGSVSPDAIFAGSLAAPQLVVRESTVAPGGPPGATYVTFGIAAINDAGQVADNALLSASRSAVFAGSLNSPVVVAATEGAVAGAPADVTYGTFRRPIMNDVGQLAFPCQLLVGGSITGANNSAIFAGTFAAPQLIARAGGAAPGTPAGATYSTFDNLSAINEIGHLLFRATLAGSGVTTANDRAIYAGPFAAPVLVAREGDQAPGVPVGVSFAAPTNVGDFGALNDAGQVAFICGLAGGGVTTSDDQALFAFDPGLGSLLVVREGSLFDVGGGDFRTISTIAFADSHGDDTRSGFADDGTLAFALGFTDGTSGVFTTTVPEPTGFLIFAAPVILLGRRRTENRTSLEPAAGPAGPNRF